jgi:hypothetical protein
MSMGTALRAIGGGPVEVMLRVQDFAMRVDHAKQMGGVGQELVAFVASGYREVSDDVWCFDVAEQAQDRVRKLGVYVRGADVLMVRCESNLSV